MPKSYVEAYKWFNLAASQSSAPFGVQDRDLVASKMTPAQLAEAEAEALGRASRFGRRPLCLRGPSSASHIHNHKAGSHIHNHTAGSHSHSHSAGNGGGERFQQVNRFLSGVTDCQLRHRHRFRLSRR